MEYLLATAGRIDNATVQMLISDDQAQVADTIRAVGYTAVAIKHQTGRRSFLTWGQPTQSDPTCCLSARQCGGVAMPNLIQELCLHSA